MNKIIITGENGFLGSYLRDVLKDSNEIVRNRMKKAKSEISHWIEYDYVLINNDLNICSSDILNILNTERMRRSRQRYIYDFISKLID